MRGSASYQIHSVASLRLKPAVGTRAIQGRSSQSLVCVDWILAGSRSPGESEGAVLGQVLLTGAQAGGGVLHCHADQVVVVVPRFLTLLCPVVVGVGAAVKSSCRVGGLSRQAALLLVVHESLLVGPGHRADHLLLAAV